jgi:Transposase DDE domain
MRHCHYTITARQVHDRAAACLQAALRLADHGPKCTAAVVLRVLFWAAARVASLAAACAALVAAPCDQAVRNALLATLPDFAQLQRRLNRALAGGLPRVLQRARPYVALDLTLLPYYGQPEDDPEELYRGHRKAGTNQFHAYATAYVICHGCRYTLGLRAVHHSDPWADVVRDLLRQVRQAGVPVRCVLLDRGFYSVDVIRYLQAARYPFLMPAIRRGRKPGHPEGPSGTWAFTTRRRSRWARYTLEDKGGRRATVTLAVCCYQLPATTRGGRLRRQRRQVWLYALWGLVPASVAWVRQTYRKRFGIESSYRQLNQARIRTSSRSPLVRLLFVGVALVLRNVWVWLHWEVLSGKRRGRRRVDLDQLPFRALLHWLQEVVEALFGVKESISSERPFLE